jgi:hypothetical protein
MIRDGLNSTGLRSASKLLHLFRQALPQDLREGVLRDGYVVGHDHVGA